MPLTRTKRQYRRHPRPDQNAPRRPKTAYVLFGEAIRQDPDLSRLPFSEVTKQIGARWRELSHEKRVNFWEMPAAEKLREYKVELEQYKQTENYQRYQEYLEEMAEAQHKPKSTILPSSTSTATSLEPMSVSQPSTTQIQEGFQATQQRDFDTDDALSSDHLNSDSQSQLAMSSIDSGMEEVQCIIHSLGINSQLIRVAAFPPEDMTANSVEAFLSGTGLLLFLWERNEALGLVKSVYNQRNESAQQNAIDIFAMAAVGSYCDGEPKSAPFQKDFLHFFICMLSSRSEMSGLRCMRLFTCLAICRFTNNVESARRLMCKRLVLS